MAASVSDVLKSNTIESLSIIVEEKILAEIEGMSDDEVAVLSDESEAAIRDECTVEDKVSQ